MLLFVVVHGYQIILFNVIKLYCSILLNYIVIVLLNNIVIVLLVYYSV